MNLTIVNRIEAVREAMKKAGVNAFIIPRTDAHLSEYIADHWHVVRYLSGFSGSAATMLITLDKAFLWTDSRYFLQAAIELEGTTVELMKDGLPQTPSIEDYLVSTLHKGDTVAIDGMTCSIDRAAELAEKFGKAGLNLVVDFSPIDQVWTDRPALPADKVFIHEVKYAGEEAKSKMAKVLDKAAEDGATSVFISALDEIAWLLNIRSNDVPCNPVATSFFHLTPAGSTLFIDSAKLTPEVIAYLDANDIKTLPYDAVKHYLAQLRVGERVLMSTSQNAAALASILGQKLVKGKSPIAMLKAIKNPVEVGGTKEAMRRDGVALVYSMMEIEDRINRGMRITEMDVAEILTRRRSEQALYYEDSFETICGFAGHGAIVHYTADETSNAVIEGDSLLLIDSGANYLDGTTDITRTVAVGTPSAEMIHDFTLVLKGHIAIATAIYPAGTRGHQLDAMARMPLWKEGKSYLHGTGHGVGHFLNVHEGPQSIRLNDTMAPLLPGMITSNEPGVYRTDKYGIRTENLVLTVPCCTTEFGEFYSFDTLTLFPFDIRLIDKGMLSAEEVEWVNAYHDKVRAELLPLLDEAGSEWLMAKTVAI